MELQTVNLTKCFKRKTALEGLNLRLGCGIYGLLGANGAGKTTLMRLLCGLQRPSRGAVLLDGRDIRELGADYSRLLGYLPQHFGYYPDFTARDFLLYAAALKGLGRALAAERAEKLLAGLAGHCLVLFSTHIISDVEFAAAKFILLRAGRLVHFGSRQELLANTGCADLEELYLHYYQERQKAVV